MEWNESLRKLRRELEVHEGYPCITLTMPTSRNMPDNAQDPIRLKNLLSEAKTRLENDLGKREAAKAIENLESAAASVDHNQNYEGLAIFANETVDIVLKTRFAMEEGVTIDDRFSLRTLLRAEQRSEPFSVLMLSLHDAKLFEGSREDLHEVRGSGFPLENSWHGTSSKAPAGPGVNPEASADESRKRFVHDCLEKCAHIKGLPRKIVLIGTPEILSSAEGAVPDPLELLTTVPGNLSGVNIAEVGTKVWAAVREARTEQSHALIERLNSGRSENKYAAGIQEIAPLALDGRVAMLVCGIGYEVAGRFDEETRSMALIEEVENWKDHDDAVEFAVHQTLEKDGEVRFVPDELMGDTPIAALLRY